MQITPQLIQDCQAGKREAQFRLYRACFPALMGVCMRYKKDKDDAAAVLNTGYMKILSNLDKYSMHIPFTAWMKRIMINTIIDEFRSTRKVRELMEYTDFTETDTFDDAVNWNEAEQQFGFEQLLKMIKTLPPVTQKVFNLYAIDGYNHREIGEMLCMSDGTSKWHLSSARKKLQELILQSGDYNYQRKKKGHGRK